VAADVSADDLLIPEGSVLLHIGPQKTGSTAIQMAMHLHREELVEHGVHYAGEKHAPREAGWAVLGKGSAIGRPPPRMRRWDELVREVREASAPRVVVSNEDFALADDDAAGRIVAGTDPERTHLVYVARRVDKLLPSHWQERVKARLRLSYDQFLEQALSDEGHGWEVGMLWSPQDVTEIVGRWSRYVDRDRITVVVADEDDRSLLPRTFERLLGLPQGLLVPPERRSNTALSYPAAEALRRVNQVAHDESWTHAEYWRIVQGGIVPVLKQREDSLPRLTGIPPEFFERVADRADRQIEAIRSAGVRIAGDPETLRIRGHVEPVDLPDPVAAVSLDLFADVVSGTRSGLAKLQARRRTRAAAPRAGVGDEASGRQLAEELGRRVRRRFAPPHRPSGR
jgi:hypothetical protein